MPVMNGLTHSQAATITASLKSDRVILELGENDALVLRVPDDLWSAAQAVPLDVPFDLISHAHAVQWAKAETGLTVSLPSGPTVRFPTDTVGRGLLNGAVTRAQQASPPSGFRWQTGATSFVTLTPAQVIAAGIAVADYIQATFDTLDDVIADILSGTITTKAQIDAAQWPSN